MDSFCLGKSNFNKIVEKNRVKTNLRQKILININK